MTATVERTAAQAFTEGLVWMTHPEHGNRNFEQDELQKATAAGWVPATGGIDFNAAGPTRPGSDGSVVVAGVTYPTLFGFVLMQDGLGNRSVEPRDVPGALEKGWTLA